MTKQVVDREALQLRFLTNMRRINAITTFLHSDIAEMKRTGLFRSEGVRADLLRTLVVFLHASLEDFVRSHLRKPNKKVSFSSTVDISRALSRLGLDANAFSDLFPPIIQLTNRRHRIVHRADLNDGQNDSASAWEFIDDWQLVQWHLAVSAFYRRIRKATGPTNIVEERASQNIESALKKNVEVAHSALKFAKMPPEKRLDGLRALEEALRDVQDTLRLDVEMFLNPDGSAKDLQA
jgi:hypothetical protein